MPSRAQKFIILMNSAGDTTAPTCTITCDQSSPSSALTFTFTATFSEDVTGFVVGDFGIANGTKGTFTAVSASVYTLVVTPDVLATVTATVAAGVCIDAAGNANAEATPLNIVSSLAIWDTFTDADTTLLTAHTPNVAPVGSSWTSGGTSHQISGNKILLDAAAAARRNIIESTLADCVIDCDVVTGQTDITQEYDHILCRVVDPNNAWEITVDKDTNFKFCILERTASVATVRAIDNSFTYAANTAYHITITLSGNSITAAISGGYTGNLSYSSAVRATETKHGFSSFMGGTVTNFNSYDNFRVTS